MALPSYFKPTNFPHGVTSQGSPVATQDQIVIPLRTPISASDTGVTGAIVADSSFIYVCVAPNTWKRVSIAAW